VYRKPTTTDTIIPTDSCNPQEYKKAAIRYLFNRMNNCHLKKAPKSSNVNTIKQIMRNKYNPQDIDDNVHKRTKEQDNQDRQDNTDPRRWAKFTYVGRETKYITKLFRNLPIRIAFTTNNTIARIFSQKPIYNANNMFDNSGVYRLTWPDCSMKYVGQTGRSFRIWFQEHHRDFKHNSTKSKFAAHLLENRHSIGKIDDIMDVLHITKKGRTTDTIEKYYIYIETKNGTQINDKNTVKPNRIFEAILRRETDGCARAAGPALTHHKVPTSALCEANTHTGQTRRRPDTAPKAHHQLLGHRNPSTDNRSRTTATTGGTP
jgi:hypothetical protein